MLVLVRVTAGELNDNDSNSVSRVDFNAIINTKTNKYQLGTSIERWQISPLPLPL